jgi:hypothetical protein
VFYLSVACLVAMSAVFYLRVVCLVALCVVFYLSVVCLSGVSYCSITATGQNSFAVQLNNNSRLFLYIRKARNYKKKTPWPKSASELHRPRDSRLSAKLVPTVAGRGSAQCCWNLVHGNVLQGEF